MLQESNAAQPQIQNQPLQPADPTVPATEWVTNLRNELPTIPRPQIPDFEALYSNNFVEDHSLPPTENGGCPFISAAEDFRPIPTEREVASLALDDMEPSTDFQEDVAFVQGTTIEALDEEDTSWIPPPLPLEPVCDGYAILRRI